MEEYMHNKPIESTDKAQLEELLRVQAVLKRLELESVQDVLGLVVDETALERNMRENGGKLKRQLKGHALVKPQRTRKEIQAAAKRKRQKRNEYRCRIQGPRRTAWSIAQVKEHGAAGWWDILSRKGAGSWSKKPMWEISKEEFVKAVGDSLENVVPVLFRYNPHQPWRLANVYIVDSETRRVVFDGAEYTLKQLGYAL